MSLENNKGDIIVVINNQEYVGKYEVSSVVDTGFDLTVWYKGKSKKERVPSYLSNYHDDIREIHGPLILEELIKEVEGSIL